MNVLLIYSFQPSVQTCLLESGIICLTHAKPSCFEDKSIQPRHHCPTGTTVYGSKERVSNTPSCQFQSWRDANTMPTKTKPKQNKTKSMWKNAQRLINMLKEWNDTDQEMLPTALKTSRLLNAKAWVRPTSTKATEIVSSIIITRWQSHHYFWSSMT